MKRIAFLSFLFFLPFLFLIICNPANHLNAQELNENIQLLDSSTYLYQLGDFYISGQPNDSIFQELKNQGLDLVVNIRTPEEMETLKADGFDEELLLDSLAIRYVLVPMGGKAGYSPEQIQKIDEGIKSSTGKIMIHCRSAGRATNAFVSWLINYRDVGVDDAINLGKQMRLKFTIEDLLGYELSFDRKK